MPSDTTRSDASPSGTTRSRPAHLRTTAGRDHAGMMLYNGALDIGAFEYNVERDASGGGV